MGRVMMKEALTYDDVLIVPQKSPVNSRTDVSLETQLTPEISIDMPLVSAPMDSVTGPDLAQEMADNGGFGILHRLEEHQTRCDWIDETDGVVGASIGIGTDDLDDAILFEMYGVDVICVDVANGHLQKTVDFVEELTDSVDVEVMVGNVATWTGAKNLIKAGADSIKIGIGSGGTCSTREKTGVGVPQFSAVQEITSKYSQWQHNGDVTFVADGGITKPGDAAKALLAGANTVMMGSIFGKCFNSPSEDIWGMASETSKEKQGIERHIEGVHHETESDRTVEEVFIEFEDGLRSALSYAGGHNLAEARKNVSFVKTRPSTTVRNRGFSLQLHKGSFET